MHFVPVPRGKGGGKERSITVLGLELEKIQRKGSLERKRGRRKETRFGIQEKRRRNIMRFKKIFDRRDTG